MFIKELHKLDKSRALDDVAKDIAKYQIAYLNVDVGTAVMLNKHNELVYKKTAPLALHLEGSLYGTSLCDVNTMVSYLAAQVDPTIRTGVYVLNGNEVYLDVSTVYDWNYRSSTLTIGEFIALVDVVFTHISNNTQWIEEHLAHAIG